VSSRLLDEHTPEQIAANASYFKDKGYALSVEEVDEAGNKKPAEVAQPKDDAAADKPVDTAPPVVDGQPVDADVVAEYQAESKENDGERLGRHARRTRELKELRETVAKEMAKREELEKLLAAKPAADAKSSAFQPPPPAVTAPAVVEKVVENPPTDTIKPKEFDKPRPVRPTIEKFQDESDPYAALSAAGVQYAEELSDWKDEKREFDSKQQAEVAAKVREVEESRNKSTEFHTTVNQRFDEIRKTRTDFDKVTEGKQITPILRFLLVGYPETGLEGTLPDGLELAYQLSLPENAETLKDLAESTEVTKGEDPRKTQARIDTARAELIAFRKELKKKAAAAPVTTEKPAEPVAVAPPAEPAKVNGTGTHQTSSATQPRREEASPFPARGRGAATMQDPKDVDPMDSDERRRIRKLRGEM